MPTKAPGLWFNPRFATKLGLSRGPVAFIDESFLSPAQNPDSFYILCAVVVKKDKLKLLRRRLYESVQDSRWHTTEAGRTNSGRQKIRELARLIAGLTTTVITVVDQLNDRDTDAEAGRARSKMALLNELALNHLYLTGTVVFEKRPGSYMHGKDLRVLERIRSKGNPASKLQVLSIQTKSEPLLWAPDLVAWCYRKAYFEKDASFFQDLQKTATVIKL